MPGHTWQGKKSAGSHTTLIDAAKPLIKQLEKMPEVKKILLGRIIMTPRARGKIRIQFTPTRSGLQARVRGTRIIQDIWIFTDFPDHVLKQLKNIKL